MIVSLSATLNTNMSMPEWLEELARVRRQLATDADGDLADVTIFAHQTRYQKLRDDFDASGMRAVSGRNLFIGGALVKRNDHLSENIAMIVGTTRESMSPRRFTTRVALDPDIFNSDYVDVEIVVHHNANGECEIHVRRDIALDRVKTTEHHVVMERQ